MVTKQEETRDVNVINAQAIADYLIYLIQQDEDLWSDDDEKPTVRSFEEAGVMTCNAGAGSSHPRWAGVPN